MRTWACVLQLLNAIHGRWFPSCPHAVVREERARLWHRVPAQHLSTAAAHKQAVPAAGCGEGSRRVVCARARTRLCLCLFAGACAVLRVTMALSVTSDNRAFLGNFAVWNIMTSAQ